MMIKFKNRFVFFGVSFIAHLFMLISFSLAISNQFGAQKNKNIYLPAYFYSHELPNSEMHQEKSVKALQQSHELTLSKNHQAVSNNIHHESIKGNSNRQLLKILHDAIAAKQSYPESALELNQRGSATVGFYLYPDGNINSISMLQSSGYESIDTAAVLAVKSVGTIAEASLYLKKGEFFTIEVVFQ